MSVRRGVICAIWQRCAPRRWAVALLALLLFYAGSAAANDPPTQAAYRRVSKICVNDLAHFCADLPDGQTSGRNAAICLKPYRASLTRPCRRAVQAIFP